MRAARALVVLAGALTASACGGQAGPQSGGFASYAGVLGCADVVAWGTVTRSAAGDEGLAVTLAVDDWVHPGTGGRSLELLADDPAREVGAPAWPVGGGRVLVVVSRVAPVQRLEPAEGERAVQQWRDAGSPRLPEEQCAQA